MRKYDQSQLAEPETQRFDGAMPIPNRSLVFHDAFLKELLVYPTATADARIRIWTDGAMLPECIVLAIGSLPTPAP